MKSKVLISINSCYKNIKTLTSTTEKYSNLKQLIHKKWENCIHTKHKKFNFSWLSKKVNELLFFNHQIDDGKLSFYQFC